MSARRRRLVLWVLLPLLVLGLVAGGAGHLVHDHADGQACVACHLTAYPAPEPLQLRVVRPLVLRAPARPAPAPERIAPPARLVPRGPPARIAA